MSYREIAQSLGGGVSVEMVAHRAARLGFEQRPSTGKVGRPQIGLKKVAKAAPLLEDYVLRIPTPDPLLSALRAAHPGRRYISVKIKNSYTD